MKPIPVEMWCRTYPVYTNAVRAREYNAGTVAGAEGVEALRADTVVRYGKTGE